MNDPIAEAIKSSGIGGTVAEMLRDHIYDLSGGYHIQEGLSGRSRKVLVIPIEEWIDTELGHQRGCTGCDCNCPG